MMQNASNKGVANKGKGNKGNKGKGVTPIAPSPSPTPTQGVVTQGVVTPSPTQGVALRRVNAFTPTRDFVVAHCPQWAHKGEGDAQYALRVAQIIALRDKLNVTQGDDAKSLRDALRDRDYYISRIERANAGRAIVANALANVVA